MKVHCVHTVHYVPNGQDKAVAAKAGTVVDDIPASAIDELVALGAVREVAEEKIAEAFSEPSSPPPVDPDNELL